VKQPHPSRNADEVSLISQFQQHRGQLPGRVARDYRQDQCERRRGIGVCWAAIGILDKMPGAQRPRTSKKLAWIIDLQEFDVDHTQTQYPFGLGLWRGLMGSVTVNAIKGAASNRDKSNTAELYGINCKPHFALEMVMTIATGEVSEFAEPFYKDQISKKPKEYFGEQIAKLNIGSNEMRLLRLMRDRLFYV